MTAFQRVLCGGTGKSLYSGEPDIPFPQAGQGHHRQRWIELIVPTRDVWQEGRFTSVVFLPQTENPTLMRQTQDESQLRDFHIIPDQHSSTRSRSPKTRKGCKTVSEENQGDQIVSFLPSMLFLSQDLIQGNTLCLAGMCPEASLGYEFLSLSVFLVTVTVSRSTGQVFCRVTLRWDLSLSLDEMGVIDFWKEACRAELSFFSRPSIS